MAAAYSLGVRSASLTAAGNLADLAAAASDRLFVREIGVFVGVAGAAPTIGLARTSAIGTRTAPTTVLAEDPGNPAGTGTMATAWSGAPTVVATDLRRATLPASLGAGVIWTWPPGEELVVPASGSLIVVLRAISAAVATAVDVYAKLVE